MFCIAVKPSLPELSNWNINNNNKPKLKFECILKAFDATDNWTMTILSQITGEFFSHSTVWNINVPSIIHPFLFSFSVFLLLMIFAFSWLWGDLHFDSDVTRVCISTRAWVHRRWKHPWVGRGVGYDRGVEKHITTFCNLNVFLIAYLKFLVFSSNKIRNFFVLTHVFNISVTDPTLVSGKSLVF